LLNLTNAHRQEFLCYMIFPSVHWLTQIIVRIS